LTGSPVFDTAKHWNEPGGLTTFPAPSSWKAKSVITQRSWNES
jgi:hypothetical protein